MFIASHLAGKQDDVVQEAEGCGDLHPAVTHHAEAGGIQERQHGRYHNQFCNVVLLHRSERTQITQYDAAKHHTNEEPAMGITAIACIQQDSRYGDDEQHDPQTLGGIGPGLAKDLSRPSAKYQDAKPPQFRNADDNPVIAIVIGQQPAQQH